MSATIVWFRKCLRLHDNIALVEAVKRSDKYLIPVFVLDPVYVKMNSGVGAVRMRFLIEALRDLDEQLQEFNSRLVIMLGKADEVLPEVFEGTCEQLPLGDVSISCCYWEADLVEPYAHERDNKVLEAAEVNEVEARALRDGGHNIYDLEDALKRAGGKAPTTMPQMLKLAERLGEPSAPLEVPSALPELPPSLVSNEKSPFFFGPPPEYLKLLGLDATEKVGPAADGLIGGERPGLKRMTDVLGRDDGNYVASFEKPKTQSTSSEPVSTTLMSPYLKFGCVSVRKFRSELLKTIKKKKHSNPPESLLGQIYFREMSYLQALSIGPDQFGKQANSPICGSIPWDDPSSDSAAAEKLEAWKSGQTGYPLIDAYMRQLITTGFMHHLGRHSVACFLTRGDLWISWEHGVAVFDQYLLDADYAVNNFNWLGLSGAAPWSPPYFRVYTPTPDPKKSSLNVNDPSGDFIRKFVPELADFPAKYIYEPWKAPIADQRKAGCVIGKDYPKRIIADHKATSKDNMARFKAAMAQYREEKKAGASASSDSSASQKKRKPSASTTSSASKKKK